MDDPTKELEEQLYNPFVINRCLSYFQDTIFLVNEMNQYPDLDKRLQYHFLLKGVRKRNRFSKWDKQLKNDELEVVKEYFDINTQKAEEYLSLLSDDDLHKIRIKMQKGGRK